MRARGDRANRAALAIIVVHDWSHGLPSTRRLLAFGFVLGVSVLIRPFSIWFVGALFVAAVVARAGWTRSLRLAAIPLAVVALMSAPWTIRNAIRMDAFVPPLTNTGDTLCLDRSSDATGGFGRRTTRGVRIPAFGRANATGPTPGWRSSS